MAILSLRAFKQKQRVLYATPTTDQLLRWWSVVSRCLSPGVEAGIFRQNATEHLIELPGTDVRVRGKTAWNSDSLRGDYARLLILDEWQLMNEDAWDAVGAPMLLDNDGDAVFVYTPPSLHSRSVNKARDRQHAAKMFKQAQADTTGRWSTFHFGSKDNPHISTVALAEISKDMTSLAYRQEILAEDIDEAPGALWTRKIIEDNRHRGPLPSFDRIVVGVDPSASSTGDEAGIVTCGRAGSHLYVLADDSIQGSPATWARAAVDAFHKHQANIIVAEKNNGGEMVATTIGTIDKAPTVALVWASRGKQTRAEPVSARSEHGELHMVGSFPALEDELCLWIPGDDSPNRLDSMVWSCAELMGFSKIADTDAMKEALV